MPRQVLIRFNKDKYIEKPTALKKAFDSRVCEMAEGGGNIPLFTNPFLLPEGKIYDMNCKIQTNYGFQIQSPNEKQFDHLCALSKRKGIIEFWCILPGERSS